LWFVRFGVRGRRFSAPTRGVLNFIDLTPSFPLSLRRERDGVFCLWFVRCAGCIEDFLPLPTGFIEFLDVTPEINVAGSFWWLWRGG